MKTTQSQITVSGNIISELSEKIPNNIIALNELIKNSYDAGSLWVEIILDSKKKILTIKDAGTGMGVIDVKKLFHISSSEKKYGSEIEVHGYKRRIQGSKGLGFLSVFKFGRKVKWKTIKDEVLEFSVDFNEVVSQYNVSDYPLEINHYEKKENEASGTEINIEIDSYNMDNLKEYLSDRVNLTKILNSFIFNKSKNNQEFDDVYPDPNFIVRLKIDSDEYETNTKLDIADIHKSSQFLRIKSSSVGKIINYYYKDKLVYSEDFDFKNENFFLNLDIQTYILESHGKKKIDVLFYNPNSQELTPLLYVNNNLFNNYTIFDTGVMKPIKQSLILSQMIGYISVISSDSRISFNSDRTQFSQNSLTDTIVNSIVELNKKIQTTGSIIKKEMYGKEEILNKKSINEDEINEEFIPEKLIKSDVLLKDFVSSEIIDGKIIYTLFGNQFPVEILKKQKEESNIHKEFFLGYIDEGFKQELNQGYPGFYRKIIYEGMDKKDIDWSQKGQWIVKDESENKIITTQINLLQPNPPQIIIKIRDVELHHIYKYDDLFTVINSFGEEDKGVRLDVDTRNETDVNNQTSKGLISFGTVREVEINAVLTDKKTKLKHEIAAYFRVNDPSKEIESIVQGKSFIKMPVSEGKNLPVSIRAFVTELNELAFNKNYSYTFVSSVRTLVELIVIDILNIKNIPKKDNLSENYELVVKDYSNFIQLINDDKDRQIVNNLIKSIRSKVERESFLAFLNLSTHGSSRIISKSEVMNKTREIVILLEYLNTLKSKSK